MPIKTTVTVVCVLSAAILFTGCAKAKCGDVCEWADGCGMLPYSEDDCLDDCMDAWDNEGDDCVNAVKDLADCIKDRGCVAGATDCDAEIADYNLACGFVW